MRSIYIFLLTACCCNNSFASSYISASNLSKSINLLNRTYSPLVIVEKTVSRDYAAGFSYDIEFYGIFNDSKFWRSIPVNNDGKFIHLHESKSADCSIEHVVIKLSNSNTIQLFDSQRYYDGDINNIPMQNMPAKQKIMVFSLKTINGPFGSRTYFNKIREFISKQSGCTSDEINKEISEFH